MNTASNFPSASNRRHAFAMAELLVSMALLTVAVVLIAQMYVLVSRETDRVRRRQIATVAAANTMERIKTMTWTELQQTTVDSWQLDSDTQQWLPNRKLTVRITTIQERPASKQIDVDITWLGGPTAAQHRVHLVMWKYQTMGTQP